VFCPTCGVGFLEEAEFCHKCGRRAPLLEPPAIAEAQDLQTERPPRNDRELAAALRRKVVRLDRCLICSSANDLVSIDFGLAKTKTGRDWNDTVASVVVSAVSLPLGGFGRLILPRKSTRTTLFTLRFTACANCASEDLDYSLHPWFDILVDYGYNQFLSPGEMLTRKARTPDR